MKQDKKYADGLYLRSDGGAYTVVGGRFRSSAVKMSDAFRMFTEGVDIDMAVSEDCKDSDLIIPSEMI
jgi:hypothetical protein